MRKLLPLILALVTGIAACGGDEEAPVREAGTTSEARTTPAEARTTPTRTGTTITLGDSEFGSMLYDSKNQAIYIFERDAKGRTVCYGECAAAWPPVLTKGEPRAAKGVDRSLLGTVERRDGSLQVTYAGQPLYFYAHEQPGEVKCHNVDLNGGLWWVVGPDGRRRA